MDIYLSRCWYAIRVGSCVIKCKQIRIASRSVCLYQPHLFTSPHFRVNHQKIQYSDKSEDLTISIRRAAQLHLNTSISRLKEDLVYLSELIDKATLDEFGLTVPDVHTLCSCDMTSLQVGYDFYPQLQYVSNVCKSGLQSQC